MKILTFFICSVFVNSSVCQTLDLLKDYELHKTIHYSYTSKNIWLPGNVQRDFTGSVLVSVDSIITSESDSSRSYYLSLREIGHEVLTTIDNNTTSQDVDFIHREIITEYTSHTYRAGSNRIRGWFIPDSTIIFSGCEGFPEDTTIYYTYPQFYRFYHFPNSDTLDFKADTLILRDMWTDCLDFGQSFEYKITTQDGLIEYKYNEFNFFGPPESQIFRKTNVTSINDVVNKVPTHELYTNYPNPFNPRTTIKYHVATSGIVRIEIFDLSGRKVKNLINEFKTPGTYQELFNSQGLSSGVYIYSLKIGNYIKSKKMILLH